MKSLKATKTVPLFLRVYGELTADVWSLICLEFNVAAQAETLIEARYKLRLIVTSYLLDALAEDGLDRTHASTLLRRKAPSIFWVKYYVYSIKGWLFGSIGGCKSDHIAEFEMIPMVPADVSVAKRIC
jgi:hypothetical protein